jgi:hypothetical protein
MSDFDFLVSPCADDERLHEWIAYHIGLNVPRNAVCPGHDAPFEYVRSAYFEPTKDLIVWAPRGGGKTRLAAVATLLDLLHKPGCAVRILGGSLAQSLCMWDHVMADVDRVGVPARIISSKRASARRLAFTTGSNAAVLTQSPRAVRGLRVQKLRCDEVELFKPDVWEAAQLVTRSSATASGAIEAISTLHSPYGLMNRLVEAAHKSGAPRVIKWCLLEVLERCPQERDCATCPLWEECRGVAKTNCDGFVSIDDAIAMKRRVSVETWEAEMLCRRPSVRGCVFPSFDPTIHVRDDAQEAHGSAVGLNGLSLAIDFGFADPFVCLWIESRDDGSTYVIDEYVQSMRTTHEHIDHIESRPYGKVRRVCCDPAGSARSDQTAASNIQILRSRGYTVKSRRSGIPAGLDLIRAALRPAFGPPRLFVHARCTHLIRALRSYRYPPAGGELPVKDGEHDHLIDALRYYFVNSTSRGDAGVRTY